MAEKTVTTFTEFKNAVEDSDTTIINLGANITFSGGAKIPTAKKSLVIDGKGFTITDNNTSSYTDCVYVAAGMGTASVTVKNVTWSGRNYYGVVCVYDDAANANVTVTYSSINYKGPQMIYNRYGSVIVDGCVISIEKNGSSASSQEFAECNRLTFSGTTTLTSETTSNAVIWFPFAGSAFTVADGANLTITAASTYMFYTDSAAKPVCTIGKNARVSISVKSGLFYSSGSGAHIFSSFELKENASFTATSSQTNGVPFFKCSGNFTANENSAFSLIMPIAGSSPLMYFSSVSAIKFNNPKSVLLYSAGGKVFSFGSGAAANPNIVTITANQINYWTKAKTPYSAAGGFEDIPATAIHKAEYNGNVTITENLSSSAVLSVSSNLTSGDAGYPISAANFDLTKSAVLSMGNLTLSVDVPKDNSEVISGLVNSAAKVSFTASQQSGTGTADGNGAFSISLSGALAVGEKVTVKSNKNFLIKSAAVITEGSVTIANLTDIPFYAVAVPYGGQKLNRLNPDWFLTLKDTRTNGGKWTLSVAVSKQLQKEGSVINDAIEFKSGETEEILGENYTVVKSGVTAAAGEVKILWSENEGIFIKLLSDTEYEKGNYVAVLNWKVEPT